MIRKEQKRPVITSDQILQAKSDAEQAKKLLESEEFAFFRNYLIQEKEKIVDEAVNNKLKKIVLKKEGYDIVHERWEQEAESSGRFKFIFEFLSYLQSLIQKPLDIEKAIKEKRVEVEGEANG